MKVIEHDILAHAETASKMLFRANLYFEAWWQSASVEGRREFKHFWDEYWEFWRFNQHAMQFAFIVYTAGLFENRADTVNFRSLWREARGHANTEALVRYEQIWQRAQPTAKSITILRSTAMAHRSLTLSFNEAFKLANVTPDQLREQLRLSWELLNIIEEALGINRSEFDPIAVDTLRSLAKLKD